MTWVEGFWTVLNAHFSALGVLGCLLICAAVLGAGWAYRGKQQERYSVFNHFISELGEHGVSARAGWFNGGLVTAGLVLLPFVGRLGWGLPGVWGRLAAVAGMVTALACMAVGLFPLNRQSAHVRSAMVFFRAGLVMVVLFSAAILVQPREAVWVPKWALLFSVLAMLAYGTFLAMVRGGSVLAQVELPSDSGEAPPRPSFSWLATVEWSIFFTTVLWFFALALIML
jgi:hypothetical membrane protein